MSKTFSLLPMAIALAIPAFATTYYVDGSVTTSGDGLTLGTAVKTVAEGIALATTAGDVVEIAAGTYSVSAMTLSREITLRGATGNPADVTLDGNKASPLITFSSSKAKVESLRLYRGGAPNGKSAIYMSSGGLVTNCIVQSASITGNTAPPAVGIYINGGGRVSGCIVRDCTSGLTAAVNAVGVRIVNGTLENSLVMGCYRSSYDESIDTLGVVYLEKGVVRNCTIAGNTVSHYPLYVANNANCTVVDTIAWGNTALRGSKWNAYPNASIGANANVTNLCTTGSVGVNPINANPCFKNAAGKDYSLMPGSPCIGAGVNGGDVGCHPFDTATQSLGVKASAYTGVNSLTTTLTLTASGYDLTGATVEWADLGETGATATHTFGPGTYSLTANVTLADSTALSVTLPNAIRVTVDTPMFVDAASANPVMPYSTPATAAATLDAALALAGEGSVIYVTNGTYQLTKSYSLVDDIKVIGTGDRDATIVKAASSCRLFYIGNAKALVGGLWMQGGTATRTAGGIFIAGDGGTVSNCVIHNCKSGTNVADGGGLRMNAAKALCIQSKIMNCGNKSGFGQGAGVFINTGTLADCIVISNKVTTSGNSSSHGGGIYLATSTANAKVINCTVAKNTGYDGGGIYRVKDAGYICNTISYNNSVTTGDGNIVAVSGTTRPPDTCISNICSTVELGVNPQKVTVAPYELPTYELSATASAKCIDQGCTEIVTSALDYAGNPRVFNGAVDIGAYEYSRTEISPGFISDAAYVVGETGKFIFTASVQGADIEQCVCSWFFDGATVEAGTGVVFTNTLPVGKHSVRLVLLYGGSEYEHEEPAGFVTVYPTDIYVNVASTASEWPYATPATAASNIEEAVSQALRPGVTLHVAAGRYRLGNTLNIGEGRRVIGAGMDETVLDGRGSIRVMAINGTGAYVEGLCVSNGASAQGSGLHIYGDGGTFVKGKIVKSRGTTNLSAGGAWICGANAKVSQSVIEGNSTWSVSGATESGSGVDHSGGGIEVNNGAILENSLVIGNRAKDGSGILVTESGKVRNCVVVGNVTGSEDDSFRHAAVRVRSGTVVNCIVIDNTNSAAASPSSAVYNISGVISGVQNCCVPVSIGSNCVTNDPLFKCAAARDYRISGLSPCRNAGLYQSWMAGAFDFFGNPRARGNKVDIGYHQSEPAAMMIYLK